MAEIVNLRQARKRKARGEKEAAAEANRLKFGRKKGDRTKAEKLVRLADRRLDGHKREE